MKPNYQTSKYISVIIAVLIISLFFNEKQLFAEKSRKYDIGGFASQAGIGRIYFGGIGSTIEYQFLLKKHLRITPIIGYGLCSQMSYSTDNYSQTFRSYVFAGGVQLEKGAKHRFLLGSQVMNPTTFILKTYSFNNSDLDYSEVFDEKSFTPILFIGYKATLFFGLFINLAAGASYSRSSSVWEIYTEKPDSSGFTLFVDKNRSNYSIRFELGLGVGYKF